MKIEEMDHIYWFFQLDSNDIVLAINFDICSKKKMFYLFFVFGILFFLLYLITI